MSASRIKYFTQSGTIVSATWSNDRFIANTAVDHLLFDGVEVQLSGQSRTYDGAVTVLASNQFSVGVTRDNLDNFSGYTVKGYLPGQTGAQEAVAIQRGMATDAIIQSYVTGTGGAQYNIDVSLDSSHWINAATVLHTTESGDTGFCKVVPGWCYVRANVASVGANTLLTILTGN